MADNRNGDRRFPSTSIVWPSLLAAALAVVGYFTTRPPLESSRPRMPLQYGVPSPPSPRGVSAVHARLWEDPLAAAYRDRNWAHETDEASWPSSLSRIFCRSDETANAASMQAIFRYIVEDNTEEKDDQTGEEKRFLCMPVLLPGGPYEDDEETRRRIRYAVLAALGTRHYKLALPQRLSYVTVPVWVEFISIGAVKRIEFDVPVKLFKKDPVERKATDTGGKEPEYDAVLICWLNESQLGDRPLLAIAQVLDALFDDEDSRQGSPCALLSRLIRKSCAMRTEYKCDLREKVDVRLIGPTGSDTLLAMAQEHVKWGEWKNEWREKKGKSAHEGWPSDGIRERYGEIVTGTGFGPYGNVTLYSPRATLSSTVLKGEQKRWLRAFTEKPFDGVKPDDEVGVRCGASSDSGLQVVRTIGTDEMLVEALEKELSLRGAWPARGSPDRILLIAERDTVYARGLVEQFRGALPPETAVEGAVGGDSDPEAAAPDCEHLLVCTYPRGLDGRIPAGDEPEKKQNETEAEAASQEEPAHGRSQLDYLRRLEGQIGQLLVKESIGKRDVRAVGIVGTDIYDKLLILRALRGSFPGARFFTTDLDARYTSKNEYKYTRNLLVASHFDLELHRSLQRDVPLFRDSYQTSTFLAVRLAINDPKLPTKNGWRNDFWHNPWGIGLEESVSKHTSLMPLVFEIGRRGAYQLTPTMSENVCGKIHPCSPREHTRLLARRNLFLLAGILDVDSIPGRGAQRRLVVQSLRRPEGKHREDRRDVLQARRAPVVRHGCALGQPSELEDSRLHSAVRKSPLAVPLAGR